MDLKWLLVRRITLVVFLCFLAGSALALYGKSREAMQQNDAIADLVARQLDLQLSRIDRSTDVPERFPDWDVVASYALQPGQCVEFRGVGGAQARVSCAGTDTAVAPRWFVSAHRALIGIRLDASRPLTNRGADHGIVLAAFDPGATAGTAWVTITHLLGLSAALVVALCLVIYLIVDRALRPAADILAGLNRLARGDLAYRLPAFRLAELNRISEVFNALSADLDRSTSERAELARRLVDTQEEERRAIARELHDEIAQKLAALNALAAAIRVRAYREASSVVDDVRELERMTSALMVSLRRTLSYLRPQEIDDLGLVQSLSALVEQHNTGARGVTRYSIETRGEVGSLRSETSAHVYRIVQEALNNAAKHANARTVKVVLSQLEDAGEERVRLSVVDDGTGPSREGRPSISTGAGLIGMRERVMALRGEFASGPRSAGGFGLEVEFPVLRRGARAS